MKKRYLTPILLIISAFISIGSLNIWSPVCNKLVELASGNMAYMKCHYTSQIANIIAFLILITGVECIFYKNKSYTIIISLGLVMTLITLNVSFVPGVCRLNTMACNSTILWLRVSGIICILAGIIEIYLNKKTVSK